jgi:hypothetical protein
VPGLLTCPHLKANAQQPDSLQKACESSHQLLLGVAAVLAAGVEAAVVLLPDDPEVLLAEALESLDSLLADSDFPLVSVCFSSVFFAEPVLPPLFLKSVTYQPPPFN